MYNIAYLRETVRRVVHRVYVGRKCTIYLRISVPRYLRDRGHETDTTESESIVPFDMIFGIFDRRREIFDTRREIFDERENQMY